MDNEIVKNQKFSPVSIEQILHTAVQKDGFDINALEKLIDLKERIDKSSAERAFNEAMNVFQVLCPVIPRNTEAKDKDNDGVKGKVFFKYASLEDIAPFIKEPLRESGLSYSHKTEYLEKTVKTTCTITHKLGHSKDFSFESPVDAGARMNNIQRVNSTLTYGKRITLKMGFGLIESGEDDDGNGSENQEGELIKPKTVVKIQKTLDEFEDPRLAWEIVRGGIETVSQIPMSECKRIGDLIWKNLNHEMINRPGSKATK